MPAVDLIVPGPLDSLTGGYIYDRKILFGLAALGWQTRTIELDASFPDPTPSALAEAGDELAAIPDRRIVVIDGLALAGLTSLLQQHRDRLRLVGLVHHPLADETGLDDATATRLEAAETTALELVNDVIVTSPWTMRRLAHFGVAAERILVVEPGVARDSAHGNSENLPQDQSLRLLIVGTVTPRKGHAVLIDALTKIAEHKWSLRCAGSLERDPDCAAALHRQIERAGLTERIDLLGELTPDGVTQEYLAADLFVLPSFLEGYGMAIAEAIAHGLPAVATAAGAIPDTLPRSAGRLVPPGDASALAAVLGELMHDRDALGALKDAALAASADVPTWEHASARFADALTRVRSS